MRLMDFQTAYNVIMALVVPAGLFVVKMIFDRIEGARARADSAHDAIAEHRTYAAESFLTIKRFEGFEERLFGELRAIREALADKVDRT